MTTVAQLYDLAAALPEVERGTHFRLPAFRVRDKVFVVVQSDDYAVLHVDLETAADAAVSPAVEQTYRGTTLVGVRVHLPELDPDDLRQLLKAAWRHRAPKSLLTQHPL